MNRKVIYTTVFIALFSGLVLPKLLHPSKGLVFSLEEFSILFSIILAVALLRKRVLKRIQKLDRIFPWNSDPQKRIASDLGLICTGTLIGTFLIYVPTSSYINAYGVPDFYESILIKKFERKGGNIADFNLYDVLDRYEFLIAVLATSFFCFLLLFSIEELAQYLNRKAKKKSEYQLLITEQLQLKANTLKKQLDPHFLFNTLNVLSGLVHENVEDSEKFIHKMAEVYRYVVEQSEELASTLDQEFQFLSSYIFLLKIRFDNKVSASIDIPADRTGWLIPSMTLELLVENAIKHNILDKENPLRLSFSIENDRLIVKNNLQLRQSGVKSLGLGLNNLKKRLDLMEVTGYEFSVRENEFVAIVPLINPDNV